MFFHFCPSFASPFVSDSTHSGDACNVYRGRPLTCESREVCATLFLRLVILMTFSLKLMKWNCFRIASRSPGVREKKKVHSSLFLPFSARASTGDKIYWARFLMPRRCIWITRRGSNTSPLVHDMIAFHDRNFSVFNCLLSIIDQTLIRRGARR